VVFGVEVPHTEGRAGMAVIAAPSLTHPEVRALGQQLEGKLPPYALPLFLRLVDAIDTTGTFKLRKKELQDEGYSLAELQDENGNDVIYFLRKEGYVPLTRELLADITHGKVGL